ncbi:unnamed protein product [Penicillium camemberti]|uniref:Str. FM013 n=1 Tax=Penicillium camemberti (strain FM 013) TaxID=1429867 RepID=A0A0G4P6Z3_PENC3|nr:unnamed protein product [Penicillium camemberti]
MQGSHPVIGGVGAPSKPDRVSLLEPGHPCSPRARQGLQFRKNVNHVIVTDADADARRKMLEIESKMSVQDFFHS